MGNFPYIANNRIEKKISSVWMAFLLLCLLLSGGLGMKEPEVLTSEDSAASAEEICGEATGTVEDSTNASCTKENPVDAADAEEKAADLADTENSSDAAGTENSDDESGKDAEAITLRDMEGAAGHPEEHHTLLRERNRTESDYRFLAFREKEGIDWRMICFDLLCKMCVSESKVRLGIFHFRLQSDDDADPVPILKAA